MIDKSIKDALKSNVCRILIDNEHKGTGFLLNNEFIITANHVIANNENIKVKFIDNELRDVTFLKSNDNDVALLKLDNKVDFYQNIEMSYRGELEKKRWFSRGYPIMKSKNGLPMDKEDNIVQQIIPIQDNYDMELDFGGKLTSYSGLSGSPLIIENRIVGMMMNELGGSQGVIELHGLSAQYFEDLVVESEIVKGKKGEKKMINDNKLIPENLLNEIENRNIILFIGNEFSTKIGKFLSYKDFIIEVLNSLSKEYEPLKAMFKNNLMNENLVLNTLKNKENQVIKNKIVDIYGGKCDNNNIVNMIWKFTSNIVTVNYDSLFQVNNINIISKSNEYALPSSNPTSKNLFQLHGFANDIENILIFEDEYQALYRSESIVKIKSLFESKTCLFIGFSTDEVYFKDLFSALSSLKKNYIISTNDNDFSKYNLEHIKIKNYAQIKNAFKNIIENQSTELVVKNDFPSHSIKLSTKYSEKINDLGVKFRHKYKTNLFLDDMFVYPDIEEMDASDKIRISSEKLLELGDFNKYILFGSEISGKTSLSYQLQKRFNENGLLPIYINAKDINNLDIKKFKNLLVRRAKKQYSKEYEETFKNKINNKCNDIVILIDNVELLNSKRFEVKKKFFEDIDNTFNNIILFSDESSRIDLKNKQILSEFVSFKIKEYGHVLRDKIIEKWIVLGRENTISDDEVIEKKDDISKKIEMIIKNKYIPTYPLYILVLLQQIETATPNNFKGSAYAEFYSYLITEALGNSKVKIDDLDYYRTYLSFISFQFYKNKTQEISEEKMMDLHTEYANMMDINKSFISVYNVLNDAKIIKSDNRFYTFNHNYIYYFFVAYYMSNNIDTNEVKEMIIDMSKNLHRVEYANIIIFLIHHSRKQVIIDNILDESSKIFSEIEPTTFAPKEFTQLFKLVETEIQKAITLDDTKSSIEYRKEHLKKKDEIEEFKNNDISVKNDNSDDISQLDAIAKINVAFKLIEILGQISKNYFGSLNKWKKREILESTYSLGLKSLNVILTKLNENIEEFEEVIKIMMDKEKIPVEDKNRINVMIKKEISDIVHSLSIMFVKKISDNIASQNLLPTISKISKDEKNFLINLRLKKMKFKLEEVSLTLNDYNYQWRNFVRELNPVVKLIELAVKLDFSGGLNKDDVFALKKEFDKNIMAQNILRFLVVEHFYKFNVGESKRQAVCEKLGISLKSQKQMLIERK